MKTKKLILTALFMCLGIIIPFFTAHSLGMQGTALLPMHLPVLLCGLLLGWKHGFVCGIFTPILSSLLTNMPPNYPMLPIMVGELATYGFISGLLYSKLKKLFPITRIYVALIIAMICGRIVYGLIYYVLLLGSNGSLRALAVFDAISIGVIGIIIQLILIPIVFDILQNYGKMGIRNAEATCIVCKNKFKYYSGSGNGVKPLLFFYENKPDVLKNAIVYDKVIGKAAAIICVLAGVRKVFGQVMSESARQYLQKHGIRYSYDILVKNISNRNGDGICPLEQSVLGVDDVEEGFIVIKSTIERLTSPSVVARKPL